MANERRKFKRVSRRFLLRFKELAMSPEAKQVFLEDLVNISASGIAFESPVSFPVGTALKLELKMDRWQKYSKSFYRFDQTSISEPFVAVGKVVRAQTVASNRYLLGVSLTNVDETHRDALERYLEAAPSR